MLFRRALAGLGAATLIATGLTYGLGGSSAAVVTVPITVDECLDRPASAVTDVSGEQGVASVGSDTGPQSGRTWDLRDATWHGAAPDGGTPDSTRYPFRLDDTGTGEVCVIGGHMIGNIPREFSRDEFYRADTPYPGTTDPQEWDNEGFRWDMDEPSDWVYQYGGYMENVSDALDPNSTSAGSTSYYERMHLVDIRDDCVENEGPRFTHHNIVIRDSLLDGCHSGFSARQSGESQVVTPDGPSALTVEDSLVYIKPNELGPMYCAEGPGPCATIATPPAAGVDHMGNHSLFKFGPNGPGSVTLRNVVVRIDMPTNWSLSNNYWPETGTYENVTLVWTGQDTYGDFPWGPAGKPAGVTVTTDAAVWDAAKTAWLAGRPPAPSPAPTPSPAQTTPTPDRYEKRVAADSDDAEEDTATGSVDATSSSDLEMVYDRSTRQTVGLRFTGVTVPQGATVTAAWLGFTARSTGSGTSGPVVRGQDADSPATFASRDRDISARPLTDARVSWVPGPWTAGKTYRTPDLAAVVQEIVDRPGWVPGNPMVFVVSGAQGTRAAWSRDGSPAQAPLLHVEYKP
ncbi:hypothetical protein [Streptomyces shaanxiensis]|uniref:Uncharacterized protein n=1 Tax=Streptomyces shaanxiensis TaxID=653357 RepID=A0ABP7V3Z6_9ACTN